MSEEEEEEELKISTSHKNPSFSFKPEKKKDVFSFDPFLGRYEHTIATRWRNFQTPIVYDLALNQDQIEKHKLYLVDQPRALTEYPYEEIAIEDAQRFVDEEMQAMGLLQNYLNQTKRKLFKNSYFKRIFPSMTCMKPGRDFYAIMALVQLFITLFLIVFFTFMERDYTNATSQTLQIRQFSGLLVLAVFTQICLMLLDRYIYIAKTFTSNKVAPDNEVNPKVNKAEFSENAMRPSIIQDTPKVDFASQETKNMLNNLVHQINKTSTYFIKPKNQDLLMSTCNVDDLPEMQESEATTLSRLNSSIKLKFYLQWFLVLFIHFVVFWFLPSKSNSASQNHFYCDTAGTDVRCNEVNDNIYLIAFYLLYWLYFYYSAKQIRYGYPELKKSNFLMKNTTPLNKLGFQIFRAVPFLLELKVFTDWSFTRTGLDVFQWIKFEVIYGDLFIARCINKGYIRHPLGQQIPKWMKFLIGI